MDTMTYLALTATGLPKNRIIGMGGALDSARFRYQLSQHLGCSPADLNAVVVGGHGDTTMIPLIRLATWNSAPVTKFLSAEQQQQIVADTMVGGATLTKLIGTSAWYAPGAAGAAMVESIVRDVNLHEARAELLRGGFAATRIPCTDDHRLAEFDEPASDFIAETFVRSGDKCNFHLHPVYEETLMLTIRI